jgi:hypothetical protein
MKPPYYGGRYRALSLPEVASVQIDLLRYWGSDNGRVACKTRCWAAVAGSASPALSRTIAYRAQQLNYSQAVRTVLFRQRNARELQRLAM